METRKPYVAGQFYEKDGILLKEQLKRCFNHELGPGLPDSEKAHNTIKGAIVPHAGLMFSGMCAAHSFKALRESGDYDCFVLIGFSHGGLESNEVVTSQLDWETPLGVAKADKTLFSELTKHKGISEDNHAMQYEHSIEVQLPFLQYLYENPAILPLMVSDGCDFKKAAKNINSAVEKLGKNVCFIASSDFTHYGPSFGFTPFTEDIKDNISQMDHEAIEHIKILNTHGFLSYLISTGATICGKNSIALLLELLQEKVNRIETLKYYTSGDILGDYTNSVSYASIIFESIKL
ncbi:MAG: AmmeMemoRadiSam system protein B [Candidatus Nanoarchaeia archaeon]